MDSKIRELLSRMSIVLLGAPYSGKGTQTRKLASAIGGNCFVMSDLIERAENDPGHPCHEEFVQARAERANGKLNGDGPVNKLLCMELSALAERTGRRPLEGVLPDGYPRTTNQYLFWKQLEKRHRTITVYVYLETGHPVLVARAKKRSAAAPRKDDGARKRRLQVFYQETLPMIRQIERSESDFFVRIDGNKDEQEVFEQIIAELSAICHCMLPEEEQDSILSTLHSQYAFPC